MCTIGLIYFTPLQAGDSGEEELTEVKSEIQSLKSDLHKALLNQEKFLVGIL